jgi:hypothetical protein
MKQNSLVRIDCSLRREVFFVVIGAIIGRNEISRILELFRKEIEFK